MTKPIIEFNDESCSWCVNEHAAGHTCGYKRIQMEQTREAIKNILRLTPAYCSGRVTCDYYVKDKDKYNNYHIGDCQGQV